MNDKPPNISSRSFRRCVLWLGGSCNGSNARNPHAYKTACSQKAPSIPHWLIAGPAAMGPMINPKLFPIVLIAIAPTSLLLGTNVGTIAERTGVPSAMNIPAINEPMIAQRIVIWSSVIIAAIAMVIVRAPIWLTINIARRFMWSLITPTGSEMSSAGTPMTNSRKPLMSDLAPRPRANQTNAKRCVLCTKMNTKLFSHNKRNGLIRSRSTGRIASLLLTESMVSDAVD